MSPFGFGGGFGGNPWARYPTGQGSAPQGQNLAWWQGPQDQGAPYRGGAPAFNPMQANPWYTPQLQPSPEGGTFRPMPFNPMPTSTGGFGDMGGGGMRSPMSPFMPMGAGGGGMGGGGGFGAYNPWARYGGRGNMPLATGSREGRMAQDWQDFQDRLQRDYLSNLRMNYTQNPQQFFGGGYGGFSPFGFGG